MEYKEAEARTYRQLFEAERARSAHLERLLRLVTAGGTAVTAQLQQQQQPSGSMSARGAPRSSRRGGNVAMGRPLSASLQPVPLTPGPLISRRSDGAHHAPLLPPRSFAAPAVISAALSPAAAAVAAAAFATAPYARTTQRPAADWNRTTRG